MKLDLDLSDDVDDKILDVVKSQKRKWFYEYEMEVLTNIYRGRTSKNADTVCIIYKYI